MSDLNPYFNHFPVQASLTIWEVMGHVAIMGPPATSCGTTLPATGSSPSYARLSLRYICTVDTVVHC